MLDFGGRNFDSSQFCGVLGMDEQGAGVEYAKELVARSIAPIKSEYLKPRDVQQEEVGCKEQENSAEEPKGTKGGKQSKREQRKQRRKVWVLLKNAIC